MTLKTLMAIDSFIAVSQNYSNCACIVQDLGRQLEVGVTMTTVSASSGICRGECATLLPFMIMLFFMTFVIAGTQMPLLMVTIRSVSSAVTSIISVNCNCY